MNDFPIHANAGLRRAFLLFALTFCAVALSACGAGGADERFSSAVQGADIGSALVITTTTIPAASSGIDYAPAALEAVGAAGPLSWTITSGTLPPGLSLTNDGRVFGTPAAPGYYEFTTRADDGLDADEQTLVLSVDTFGLSAVDGLHFGDAWSGVPVTLQCAGFAHAVAFEVVVSDSGGHLEQVDVETGSAIWIPGPDSAPGTQDIIRANCATTGLSAELTLDIAPDTTALHTADFASSDVWYLDFGVKRGAHPYRSDFHAALAHLGLRNSTAALGSEADQLAALVTRVSVLRHLNRMYLRNEDGSAGAQGLAISFPLERPGAGYAAPVPGGVVSSQPHLYNILSICDHEGSLSAYGIAIVDVVGNPRIENNTPGGRGPLGVFVNYIADTVDNTYREHHGALRADPISQDDIPALKAILYGRSDPGGRYEVVRYFVDALAESVAYIVAHESAHSLGLGHTSAYTPGSIMNNVGIISPGAEHFFLADDLARLQLGLPGGGRVTGAQKVSSPQMAAITVCDGGCGHGH